MKVPTLKVAQSINFEAQGNQFRVKRLDKSTYHLKKIGQNERSRFGTRKDIQEDVNNAMITGELPPAEGRF